MPKQPDVAITDLLLSVECIFFLFLLQGRPAGLFTSTRRWFILLFASVACASLLGGIYHGFLGEASPQAPFVWLAVMFLVGMSALCESALAIDLLDVASRRKLLYLPYLLFALYSLALVFYRSDFKIGILAYCFGLLLLLSSFLVLFLRTYSPAPLMGAAALLLAALASYLQQRHYSFSPKYLSHNASFHVLQFIALLLLFFCAKSLITVKP